jgi:protein-L-isoaspartate(D-aspartate) O-methyltransferase
MIRTIEEKEIDKKFETLKQFCTNCTPDELDKLDAAYRYAAKVYGDKINSSGELLISHSLSVARIVAEEIGLRSVSLIAALLHDVINTADDNCEEIESKFGKDVATIVRGFKKVSVIDSEKVKLHSENFRSLFLSMIDDVRVIFIKIAHQLYDLRNYSSLTEFQKKIFLNDVQYLYIPITHRMGLYHIKAQLEDMAFRHSYPVEYSKIESRLHKGLRQHLINNLRIKGIKDENVLDAMMNVPRHHFMDSSFIEYAYQDKAFPIGSGQTISQPYTVAFQTELLNVEPGHSVLEIGTGSGYQAVILYNMGAKVYSIERQYNLYRKVKLFFDRYNYKIKVFYRDGYDGLSTFAPFDRIIITAAVPLVPEALKRQLKIGGILVAPVGQKNHQTMIRLIKKGEGEFITEEHGGFVFVPMLPGKAED